MKKTTRLIGLVAIALVLLTAFSGVAFASRNVPAYAGNRDPYDHN